MEMGWRIRVTMSLLLHMFASIVGSRPKFTHTEINLNTQSEEFLAVIVYKLVGWVIISMFILAHISKFFSNVGAAKSGNLMRPPSRGLGENAVSFMGSFQRASRGGGPIHS
jgi:hypothetical protein